MTKTPRLPMNDQQRKHETARQSRTPSGELSAFAVLMTSQRQERAAAKDQATGKTISPQPKRQKKRRGR